MSHLLEPLVMPRGRAVLDKLPQLRKALDGDASFLPLPDPSAEPERAASLTESQRIGEPIQDEVALIACTSGSTGTPKGAMLTGRNLTDSADATHARLGGSGQWLLATPPDHIAGLQAILRSMRAGHEPAVLDITDGFNPAGLPAAIASMTGTRRYIPLVPLQLKKALENPAATEALGDMDAILLGGQAADAALLRSAEAAGINVVTSYGSSETCGGVVYGGIPLDGTSVHIEDDRITIEGPTVSIGYRNTTSPDLRDGVFRTSDTGEIDGDGLLRVLGRADDMIVSGGLKFLPGPIEDVIVAVPGVRDAAVVPVPDERLGQAITALIVIDETRGATTPHGVDAGQTPQTAVGAALVEVIQQRVGEALGTYAAPRTVVGTSALPILPSGKLDRAKAVRLTLGTHRQSS